MRYTNRHFTYLLTYLLTYLPGNAYRDVISSATTEGMYLANIAMNCCIYIVNSQNTFLAVKIIKVSRLRDLHL